MQDLIVTLQNCPIYQDADGADGTPGRVHFLADADIDADGANGETLDKAGKPIFAYAPGDHGADLLRNAGYPSGCYHDILVCPNASAHPIVFGGGYYSSTAYQRAGRKWDDPQKYLDSTAIPYVVVEDYIRRKARGVVLGCRARVTNTATGESVDCMVGDLGPLDKIGELSIAAAEAIGIPSSPRTGGEDRRTILYELFPGQQAVIHGETFPLMPRIG